MPLYLHRMVVRSQAQHYSLVMSNALNWSIIIVEIVQLVSVVVSIYSDAYRWSFLCDFWGYFWRHGIQYWRCCWRCIILEFRIRRHAICHMSLNRRCIRRQCSCRRGCAIEIELIIATTKTDLVFKIRRKNKCALLQCGWNLRCNGCL